MLFVALNTAIAGGACVLLWRSLPALASEPAALFVVPMTVLTAVALALVYPIMRRRPALTARTGVLYGAFVAALVAYGVYLWWRVPDGTAMMIPVTLLAGHTYGLPMFGAIWLVQALLGRFFFP